MSYAEKETEEMDILTYYMMSTVHSRLLRSARRLMFATKVLRARETLYAAYLRHIAQSFFFYKDS